ncbi:PREDICTED: LETM1 domain-containing protein 1 [Ficedula albicollis]|uniref:LETM1 domain-containing protein 1 n=1 Tax=Ficedula albicollis TaxID=59894 RepID=UPI0007AD8A70|nr:PREDICTED: LETM1 domain-containing protein 1 [Ficedula albicollis]
MDKRLSDSLKSHCKITGIQALFLEVKEIRKIKSKMSQQRLSTQQLPYREMERLRQFRRDLLKAIPIGIIAIPPFANFLVIVLICAQVQGGAHPQLAQLLALRSLFSGSVLALNRLRVDHVRALSQVLFLTPYLPAVLLRPRLRSHVLEIQQLDRALLHLGPGQLSGEELRAACYLRGLDSTHLGQAECRAWLEQWLGLSCQLQASDASLLAHSMVLLSLNYGRPPE